MDEISHLKCNFQERSGEETGDLFRAGSFFLVSYMDCLSKCHNSKKTPLPKKIPGCALVFIVLSGTIFDFLTAFLIHGYLILISNPFI